MKTSQDNQRHYERITGKGFNEVIQAKIDTSASDKTSKNKSVKKRKEVIQ